MEKVIVFDFDDTLTTFDTIFPFFNFSCENNLLVKNTKILALYFLMFLYKAGIISNKTLKNFGIKLFIKGLDKSRLIEISEKFIKQLSYHNSVLAKLEEHLQKGEKIIISSASFEEYLNISLPDNESVVKLSSKIKYINNKAISLEFNNYGAEKVNYFKNNGLKIDTFYTDSYSDRFLAEIAEKTVIVKKDGTMETFNRYSDFCNFFGKKDI